MTVGMILIPVGDALAKFISTQSAHTPGFLAWSRFAFGVIFLLPVGLVMKVFHGRDRAFYYAQALRGFCISMTLVFIITAVSLSPLADVFGAFFIGPVFATILSVLLLGERVNWLGWLCVIFGFVGVVMVVQPGLQGSTGVYFALLAGIFYGSFLTATRWAADSGPPFAQLLAQMLFGFVFLMPFGINGIYDYSNEDLQTAGLILVMGFTSAAANLASIIALKRASAAYLAPVVYLQVVAATIISVLFFNDSINTLALAGLAVIVFTGILKIPPSTLSSVWSRTVKR